MWSPVPVPGSHAPMPGQYSLEFERRLVLSIFEGCLTDRDLSEHQRLLKRDPLLRWHFRRLVDVRS